VEVMADVYNVFSLIGSTLGDIREAQAGSAVTLLGLTGYDRTNGRGIYRLIPVERAPVSNDVSHWRIQLGMRFVF
jgi:hypothetical protein